MKLARQYFVDKGEPQRVHFIARKGAFHGTTLGSLALTAKAGVQRPFEPIMLSDNASFVSMPNLYRGTLTGETETQYAARLAQELDDEFERVGPNRVCAFIAETMSGTVRFTPVLTTCFFTFHSDIVLVHGLSCCAIGILQSSTSYM